MRWRWRWCLWDGKPYPREPFSWAAWAVRSQPGERAFARAPFDEVASRRVQRNDKGSRANRSGRCQT